jgi:predicted AlkP superfamily phosphohydrolase/phosphomutase
VEQPQRKVIVIGWDGASFDLAQGWIDKGLLPNLAKIREQGAYGELASTIPPVSAPAWATFVTGNNPGRHGIYYFKEHVPGTYDTRLTLGSDRRTKPLWKMLNEQGLKMGAVNLVMTYPPESLDGFIVSGMDTPGPKSQFTYPPSLKDDLLEHLGEYIIEPALEEDARNYRYDALWSSIWGSLENGIEAVRYLLSEHAWDVFAVNFRATDSVQHHFWKFMDASHPQHDPSMAGPYRNCILKVYQRLDEFVGEVRAGMGPDDRLIVMSDHGFGPTSDKVLYLNNWLAQQGWLTLRQKAGDLVASRQSLPARLKTALWQRTWVRLRQIAPQWLKDLLERLAPALYQRIRYPAAYFFIDWEHSAAYADEYQESIWINLVGREPAGVVQPGAEYEALRREIVERLRDLRDPLTGEPAIEMACLREEIYHGAALDLAPDIVVITRQDPYFRVRPSHTSPGPDPIQTLTREELLAEYLPNGVHRLHGMFYAMGNGIATNRRVEGMGIVDMTPTILHLAGCRVPRGLDGRVINQIFGEEPHIAFFDDQDADADFSSRSGYDDEEEAQVAEKLRGLGYL